MKPEISIIIPSYNERDNIPLIVEKINTVLNDVAHEIIIVDDNSPDLTWQLAEQIALKNSTLRCIRRITERGLSSAVITGMASARGDFLIVMDADLQHDETVLPQFIEKFYQQKKLVIGTRKSAGGGIENWSILRRFVSNCATLLAKIILPNQSSDPMSGYFGISKKHFEALHQQINPRGFKILLEFLYRSSQTDIAEVGYTFRPRIHGESKLSGKVILQYIIGLYDLRFGEIISLQFIKYSLVGASGVVLNLLIQYLGDKVIFTPNQLFQMNHFFFNYAISSNQLSVALAIEVSLISNYFLNNFWTFRAQKKHGFLQNLGGISLFHLICLAGALINLAVFTFAFEKLKLNPYLANLTGIVFATGWNYFLNTNAIWRSQRS